MIDQVCEALKKSDLLPKQMLADALYGSDDNVQKCAKDKFDLICPVSGKVPTAGKMIILDFEVDEKNRISNKMSSWANTIKIYVLSKEQYH